MGTLPARPNCQMAMLDAMAGIHSSCWNLEMVSDDDPVAKARRETLHRGLECSEDLGEYGAHIQSHMAPAPLNSRHFWKRDFSITCRKEKGEIPVLGDMYISEFLLLTLTQESQNGPCHCLHGNPSPASSQSIGPLFLLRSHAVCFKFSHWFGSSGTS